MKMLFAAISCVMFLGDAAAGEYEVTAAKGIGYSLVIVEKCTGIAPDPNYVPSLRSKLSRHGFPEEDFKAGFAFGAIIAEGKFSGKPPKKECDEAQDLISGFTTPLGLKLN